VSRETPATSKGLQSLFRSETDAYPVGLRGWRLEFRTHQGFMCGVWMFRSAGRRAQGVGHRAQVSGRVFYWVSRSTVIVDSPDRSRSNA